MRLSFLEGPESEQSVNLRDTVMKRRKVIRIGNSFYINLPMKFLKKHRIKQGSYLAVIANDSVRVIVP